MIVVIMKLKIEVFFQYKCLLLFDGNNLLK